MNINTLKNSIKIFEFAYEELEMKSDEGLINLSKLGNPQNVIHLININNDNDNDIGINTLLASQRIPSIILLSLTIEQTLKLLIYQESNKEFKRHELNDLFNKLSIDLQTDIINLVTSELKISDNQFNDFLKENSLVFINWRYFYEQPQSNSAAILFLSTFFDKLKMKIK
jgi:hypothetical protein